MEARDKEPKQPQDPEVELTPGDEAFWDVLASRLTQADHPGLCLSDQTVALLQQVCPPVAGDEERQAALVAELERTAEAIEFEATMQARRQEPSLGSYVSFLVQREGLSIAGIAKETDWDFQLLKELENDRVSPQRIPARPLALLMQRLQGSLELIERLLWATVHAPRYQGVGGRGSLYRGAPGASRLSSEAASLAARGETGQQSENPEYQKEWEAAGRLVQEVRAAWRAGSAD
jgi:hypothetical protein